MNEKKKENIRELELQKIYLENDNDFFINQNRYISNLY